MAEPTHDGRVELLAEAALILEQEGWILARMERESHSRRLRAFRERYDEWQEKVKAWRAANPGVWVEPPDNS